MLRDVFIIGGDDLAGVFVFEFFFPDPFHQIGVFFHEGSHDLAEIHGGDQMTFVRLFKNIIAGGRSTNQSGRFKAAKFQELYRTRVEDLYKFLVIIDIGIEAEIMNDGEGIKPDDKSLDVPWREANGLCEGVLFITDAAVTV